MATKYVSQTATNGYAVGSDANDGSTKALAKLTLEAAITVAANNDTIVINDGTYTAATYFDITKPLTINPENNYLVTLMATSGGYVVDASYNGTSPITLGALIIDANNAIANAMRNKDIGSIRTLTLNGTHFKNSTGTLFSDETKRGTTVFNDALWTGVRGGYATTNAMGQAADKTITFNGSAFDMDWTTNVAHVGIDITRYSAGVPAGLVTVTISEITGTFDADATVDTNVYGIFLTNLNAPVVQDCNFSMSTVAPGSAYGVNTRALSTNARGDGAIIRRNAITLNATSGYGILIGSDTSTLNYCDNAVIYENTINGIYTATGSPHGIVLGNVTGGRVYSNTVYDSYVGFMASINQGGQIFDNVCDGCYGTVLYAKGCGATTAPVFRGNSVLMRNRAGATVSGSGALAVAAQGGTNNAKVRFIDNRVYGDDLVKFVKVEASQEASFDGNNYYCTGALPADCFTYQASNYSTVATWAAAREFRATDYAMDPDSLDRRVPVATRPAVSRLSV